MKEILMMKLESCPYCHEALSMMEELKQEHPEYQNIQVKMVNEDEDAKLADSLDYWYVPTYYVDGEKLHEGVPTKEKIRKVYEAALK
ncbi:thioredoxin family protein [Anaerostipes sp.]|uniref:thioredoxin family protein n=1 Tax=Anaerostipes sp. TaxID=1872530 RepID=UPI0025C67F40|nr:thioredoxin family protein [Anaerostipes sp.]MBS7009763.1 thioredoxin family protein [Anaerostipes sp.]